MAYRPPLMSVVWDDGDYSGRAYVVVAGNAERSAGGGMRLSPGARTDDGELNVSVIPAQTRLKMALRMFPKISSGDHVKEPGVLYFPVREITVESDPPVPLEVDGDLFGTTPVKLHVCPGALRIRTPPEA